MASGDVVLAATHININSAPDGTSGNVLSFVNLADPTTDDGGYITWLYGALNSDYQVAVMVRVTFSGSPATSISHPPFDPTKFYDVTIKEH
jgi:hypothetical protein